MNWFLAKIVFRIVCGAGNHKPQFDEQLRLIAAPDRNEAYEKAAFLGKNGEDTFYNQDLQRVQWQFINIAELHPLNNLADGVELYSSVQEVENADDFITFVHHKAAQLYQKENTATIQTV